MVVRAVDDDVFFFFCLNYFICCNFRFHFIIHFQYSFRFIILQLEKDRYIDTYARNKNKRNDDDVELFFKFQKKKKKIHLE